MTRIIKSKSRGHYHSAHMVSCSTHTCMPARYQSLHTFIQLASQVSVPTYIFTACTTGCLATFCRSLVEEHCKGIEHIHCTPALMFQWLPVRVLWLGRLGRVASCSFCLLLQPVLPKPRDIGMQSWLLVHIGSSFLNRFHSKTEQ
jgi:hypothetical protein